MLVVLVAHSVAAAQATPAGERVAASAGRPGQARGSAAPTTIPATTTTLPPIPAATPTLTIPEAPTTTLAVAPPTPASSPPPTRGITPPAVPPADIAPDPNFLQSCSGSSYDGSAACTTAALQAIDNARDREGLAPMTLPSNWAQLTPGEQIFVATDLERTVRGLPPLTAMATTLDQTARQGAAQNTDPAPPAGFPYSQWGSNWAGAVGNPLEADYLWMYDDGVGSANVDCTAANPSGCWGHRQNVLLKLPCRLCVMGTAWLPGGYSGDPSLTELLVETSGTPAVDFTWQQESPYVP